MNRKYKFNRNRRHGLQIRTSGILILMLSVYVALRFIFSYTLINQPYMLGTNTYEGGDKYDFPVCVLNPVKIKGIKNYIVYNWEEVARKAEQTNREKIYSFFGTLDSPSDFDIISVAVSQEDMIKDKTVDSFLLQQKKNTENKCVVVIDKKTKQLLRIRF